MSSLEETTGFSGPALTLFASFALSVAACIAIDSRLLVVLALGMFLGAFGAVVAKVSA